MRQKGNNNKVIRYELFIFDTINKEWVSQGLFPNYKKMGDVVGLTYDNIRDVSLGRSAVLSRFYKVEKKINNTQLSLII